MYNILKTYEAFNINRTAYKIEQIDSEHHENKSNKKKIHK